jgi:hypothetical protein
VKSTESEKLGEFVRCLDECSLEEAGEILGGLRKAKRIALETFAQIETREELCLLKVSGKLTAIAREEYR